jgi:adenine-specific DNA-methyltransferase
MDNIEKMDISKIKWRSSEDFFNSLGKELDKLDNKDESYEFNWVGKRKAIIETGSPINKTLRPDVESSKDWDNTENLFIEGDNLDALKLLQESYLGKVKMIYIDPPYNTGKDFVYHDNFKANVEDYDEATGYKDEEGNIQFKKNEKTNGRYHSDWLSMMYPRLKLAKNLLSDDGVIFISIDDNEQANLKKLCDEVFGEDKHIGTLTWLKKRKGSFLSKKIISIHEYCLVYGRNIEIGLFGGRADKTESQPLIKRTSSKSVIHFPADSVSTKLIDNIYKAGIYGKGSSSVNLIDDIKVQGGIIVNDFRLEGPFIWTQSYLDHQLANGAKIEINTFNLQPRGLKYDDSNAYKGLPSVIDGVKLGATNEDAYEASKLLFGAEGILDYPKPVNYIRYLISAATEFSKDSLILDFFSGSGTTAHAVMQLNAEDGGSRKWIMVQLPEETGEKSEAYKAGYKNIPEIARERIRRAGDKIAKEHPDAKVDYGFRALKIDDLNEKDVHKTPGQYQQDSLLDSVDNIKEDRSDLDLLYGVLIKSALELNKPIQTKDIDSSKVYMYDYFGEVSGLIACFEKNISETVVKEIAKLKPLTAVFRDSSFPDSQAKINLSEHFRMLSPETKVKVI